MNSRPSILRRPIKSPSQHNAESADAQWEREQSRLRAKQEKYVEYNDMIRRRVEPTPEDRAHLQDSMNASIQTSAAERAVRAQQEDTFRRDDPSSRVTADEWACYPFAGPETKASEVAAKREYERSIMEENRRAAEAKAAAKKAERQAERQADADAQGQDWFRSTRHNEFR